jgi:hypothetical protein
MSNNLTKAAIISYGSVILFAGFVIGYLLFDIHNQKAKKKMIPEKVIVHDTIVVRDTVTVFKKEKFPKGAFLVIPADEHEGRKTYSVLIDDKFGMDFMYPEEIALSLIEGKWQYDEMAKLCTYETCADICEEPVVTKKVN